MATSLGAKEQRMATPISPHFTLEELCRSETAVARGIDNLATDPTVIANLTALAANVLEPIRGKFGPFSPTSGYRGPTLNKAVGGVATSQHSLGQAADFVIPGVDLDEIGNWIIANVDFDQVINEQTGSAWIHVSYKSPTVNRRSILRYDGKTYTTVRSF
jgi:zinc D-Ala-D-Ala carboxypeptidase